MLETIKKMLSENYQIDPDTVTAETDLRNDLGINSIELADLVFACEEEFGVEFKDEDFNKIATVGDVISFIEENA